MGGISTAKEVEFPEIRYKDVKVSYEGWVMRVWDVRVCACNLNNDLTMTSYLHVDLVVLSEDKVPTDKRRQEVVHRVAPPTQPPQQVEQ